MGESIVRIIFDRSFQSCGRIRSPALAQLDLPSKDQRFGIVAIALEDRIIELRSFVNPSL